MKKRLLAFVALISLTLLPAAPVYAVDVIDPVCQNVSGSDIPAVCKDNQTGDQGAEGDLLFGKNGILTKVLNIFSLILGVTAVIVLMIAGIRFIASNADPQTITSARMSIIFAVIGLVIAILAQAVVRLALSNIG